MTTTNYWSAIILTVLITEVLFSTALYSLPGPDDYKKTADDVKKAVATPTPRGVVPGPDDYKKLKDAVDKASTSSKAGTLPTAPAPEDVNNAVNAAKGNPAQDKPKASTSGAQSSSAPYQFYDRYTDGTQKRDPLPTTWDTRYPAGSNGPPNSSASGKKGTLFDINNKNGVDKGQSQQSTSDTEDWHKKNKNKKNKHHGNANGTYDGSPVLYNKPKPTSDAEDWHKKNKKNKHHGDANSTYDGSPILYTKPKPTSDTEDWHKKNKNGHRHHDDDQD